MYGAHQHDHHFPCLHCHPQSYIRMVQHLIERCLLLHMTREDCVRALAKRANIRPLVTLTVWKELLKENRGFFTAYFQDEPDQERVSRTMKSRKQQARTWSQDSAVLDHFAR
ncbi:uncharacterized protein LOC109722144 isoform X2 [Ananas comosus]|uniref:Uncharacterized protein LOC109722144 isoform X2 n=1 Tax=Ananas comosus TaxID=4615 RepID=A0A6P5GK20_ANACO|nr:uncharacterized protein LOC109722144 isoform X2 [Ananas comosus]